MGLLKRNKVWWMSFMYQGTTGSPYDRYDGQTTGRIDPVQGEGANC